MAKSKSPTVRALDELKAIHEIECSHIRHAEYEENERLINSVKTKLEKNAVELIVKAITTLDIPFVLEHKTVCNVRTYNGSLRFDLTFDARKAKECVSQKSANIKIISQRDEAHKRLHEWYLSNLYNVAGRETISEFKV